MCWPHPLSYLLQGVAALALLGGVHGGVRALELPFGRLIKLRADAGVEDFADCMARWARLIDVERGRRLAQAVDAAALRCICVSACVPSLWRSL